MKNIFLFLALSLSGVASAALTGGGSVSQATTYKNSTTGYVALPVVLTDANGTVVGVSGSGGASASAANQDTQIALEKTLTGTAATIATNTGLSAGFLTGSAATAANQLSQITSLQQSTTTAATISTNTGLASGSLTNTATGQTAVYAGTSTSAAALLNASTVSSSTAPVPLYTNFIGYRTVTSTAFTGITANANTTFNVTSTAGVNNGKPLVVKVVGLSGAPNFYIATADDSTVPPGFAVSTAQGLFVPLNTTLERFEAEMATGAGRSPHFFIRSATLSGATSGTIYFEILEKL